MVALQPLAGNVAALIEQFEAPRRRACPTATKNVKTKPVKLSLLK